MMAKKRGLLRSLENLGHWFFYVVLKIFGHMGGIVLLGPVICSYVLFSRKIHRRVGPYLRRRFPNENQCQYWFRALRNLFSFGHVLVDRGWLGVRKKVRLEGEFTGYDTLRDLIKEGKGLVLLTAHVGNWQSALAHLGELPVTVHALMQYDQQAAAKHYFDLSGERPFEIINVDEKFGGMVDALTALGRGEVVTIMGDRYIKGTSSMVPFLGDEVKVPNGAYMLAASAGSPVAVVLAAKTGRSSYQLKVWDVFTPSFKSRDERAAMLDECASKYMRAIEEYLKIYPYQWYNFYNFWKQ